MRRAAGFRRTAPFAAALALAACATPLERGEQLYRAGDRAGAIETWRGIAGDSHAPAAARQRMAAVEDEQQKLLARYEQRGRYFERKGRLAEAILSWRVVLKLEPDDAATLAHVQDLGQYIKICRSGDKIRKVKRRNFESHHHSRFGRMERRWYQPPTHGRL